MPCTIERMCKKISYVIMHQTVFLKSLMYRRMKNAELLKGENMNTNNLEQKLCFAIKTKGNFKGFSTIINRLQSEYKTQQKSKRLHNLIPFIISLAVVLDILAIFLAVALLKPVIFSSNKKQNQVRQLNYDVSSPDTVILKPFNEWTTYEKYRSLNFNGKNYFGYEDSMYISYIAGEFVDKKIGEFELELRDLDNFVIDETNAAIYQIEGISPDFGIAVKFEKEEGCYFYSCTKPLTYGLSLDEFMNELSFDRYFLFQNATYSYLYSNSKDSGVVKHISSNKVGDNVLKFLKTNKDTKNVYSSKHGDSLESFTSDISIKFSAPSLGLNNIAQLRINLDGRSTFASFIGTNTFLFPEKDVVTLKKSIISKA